MLDAEGIFADQQAGQSLYGVFGAALADAGDTLIGLDGDNAVALFECRPAERRFVIAEAGDLDLGQAGQDQAEVAQCSLDERPSFHGCSFIVRSQTTDWESSSLTVNRPFSAFYPYYLRTR